MVSTSESYNRKNLPLQNTSIGHFPINFTFDQSKFSVHGQLNLNPYLIELCKFQTFIAEWAKDLTQNWKQ